MLPPKTDSTTKTPAVHIPLRHDDMSRTAHSIEPDMLARVMNAAVLRLDDYGIVVGILGEGRQRIPFLPFLGQPIKRMTNINGELEEAREKGFSRFAFSLKDGQGTRDYTMSLICSHKSSGERELLAIPKPIPTPTESAVPDQDEVDSLTGLGGIKAYYRAAKEIFAGSAGPVAVMMMDLDRFQNVNEAFGHAASDMIIRDMAHRMQSAAGSHARVFRHGGDAFIVVMHGDREAALARAKLFLEEVRRPLKIDGLELQIFGSIGMSIYPDHIKDAVDALDAAEVALMRAKNNGRHRTEVFDPASREVARERMQIQSALNEAVASNELCVVYQPKVKLSTGEFAGVEALLRMGSDLFMPAKFIPVAEESGLIEVLGEWILNRACETALAMSKKGVNCSVAVNVSARQFMRGDFDQVVSKALAKTGTPPKFIEIEITESALIMDPAKAADAVNRLRKLGVRVAVDDFGTGFSSLSHLKKFKIDTIKIDKSFVAGLPDDHESEAIVRAVIEMGHALHIDIVAEGVENKDSLRFLLEAGCDVAQGYYLSQPLTEEKMHLWIDSYAAVRSDAA